MKTKPLTQSKSPPSSIPAQVGFLQRKCACGGSSGKAGGCEGCKKKRPNLLGYAADLATPSEHGHSLAEPSATGSRVKGEPHLAHNLSGLAIHSRAGSARAPQARSPGGEVERAPTYDPQGIVAQLGSGQSFSGSSRSRMESVFHRDFSHVRIHTDAKAAQLSRQLDAQAFTIGHHVSFASGRYQPGTMIGDALLAHELAHVTQQSSANPSAVAMQSEGAEYDALERDADVTAAHAVVSLWGRAKGLATDVTHKAMPRMQSGLRLSLVACKSEPKAPEVEKKAPGGEKAPEPAKTAPTCDDICSRAYADSSLNEGGGGVICDGATKCACVFDVYPTTKGECPDLDADVLRHETAHLGDVDCDASKGLHRPPFKDPSKAIASECSHRTSSIAKLDEAIKAATEPCKTKLTTIRGGLDTWVKANCGGP